MKIKFFWQGCHPFCNFESTENEVLKCRYIPYLLLMFCYSLLSVVLMVATDARLPGLPLLRRFWIYYGQVIKFWGTPHQICGKYPWGKGGGGEGLAGFYAIGEKINFLTIFISKRSVRCIVYERQIPRPTEILVQRNWHPVATFHITFCGLKLVFTRNGTLINHQWAKLLQQFVTRWILIAYIEY